MKPLFLSFLVCGSVTAFAQTTPSAGKSDSAPPVADKPAVSAAGIDETTRLEQEYMARRAEWVALRSEALERTKKAPEAGSRKQITDQLAEDEKPLLAKMSVAARAYRESAKRKHPDVKPAK